MATRLFIADHCWIFMPLFNGVRLIDHHIAKSFLFDAAPIVTSKQVRNSFKHNESLAIYCNDEQRPRDAYYRNGYWV